MFMQLFVVLVRIIHNAGTIYHIFHEKLDGYLISMSLNPHHTICTRYCYNIETLLLRIQLFGANSNEKELFDKIIQLGVVLNQNNVIFYNAISVGPLIFLIGVPVYYYDLIHHFKPKLSNEDQDTQTNNAQLINAEYGRTLKKQNKDVYYCKSVYDGYLMNGVRIVTMNSNNMNINIFHTSYDDHVNYI